MTTSYHVLFKFHYNIFIGVRIFKEMPSSEVSGTPCTFFSQAKILFYVLLTVHLGIILFNDQLDAQFLFCICLFRCSAYLKQPCAHHQDSQLYQYDIWHMSLCVGDRLVCRYGWSIEIYIYGKKIMRQVGYLQEIP